MQQYDNLMYEIQEKSVIITGVTKTDLSDIKIPEAINSHPVRKIGFRAFAGQNINESCRFMQSVELPYGLTDILDGAFASCTSLEKLIIPPGVNIIEKSAFYNCRNLKEVEIPDSVTSLSETAFEGCTELEGITIAYYDKSVRRPGNFPDLFSSESAKPGIPRILTKQFVYIPSGSDGLYGEYVTICGKDFSWDKYDSLFSLHMPSHSKVQTAIFRLQNPADLNENARLIYESFLKINSAQFIDYYIKTDNLEMIVKFGSLGMITNQNINDCIVTAQITGSNNVLLYLIAYRYKKLRNQ